MDCGPLINDTVLPASKKQEAQLLQWDTHRTHLREQQMMDQYVMDCGPLLNDTLINDTVRPISEKKTAAE